MYDFSKFKWTHTSEGTSSFGREKKTCLLELVKLSCVTEAPTLFVLCEKSSLCLWEMACMAGGALMLLCEILYESSQIFWYVCCYPSISSRWISGSSTAGCLILFLFFKMNISVPYSRMSSSVLWASILWPAWLPLAQASSPLINVTVQDWSMES